jgi:hypothetical protein
MKMLTRSRHTRRHLAHSEWPAEDQALWEAATVEDDVFSEAAGARLAPATIKRYFYGWSRFLGFLALDEPAALRLGVVARVTKPRIVSFVEHLRATNIPRSVAAHVEAAYHAARIMMPEQNWSWLKLTKSRLHHAAPPSRGRGPVITSMQLLDLGLELLTKAERRFTGLLRMNDAVLYRDGVMIALSAFVPIRRKNHAEIRIGHEFQCYGDGYLISLPDRQTKTKKTVEFEVPEMLVPYLTTYLTRVRPRILRMGSSSALWVSPRGGALSYSALGNVLPRHAECRLKIHLSMHDVRDAAATTWAIAAPDQILVSRDLLGHTKTETAVKHYNRAKGIEASRSYSHILKKRRGWFIPPD